MTDHRMLCKTRNDSRNRRRYTMLLVASLAAATLPAAAGNRALAAGGPEILFVTNRDGNSEIYVMDGDGTNQTNLTNNVAWDGDADWSPDKTKIVFASQRDTPGSRELFVMNADGSNVVRLTNNTTNDSEPAFSPDGTRIAFIGEGDGYGQDIHTMDTNGANVLRLSTSGVAVLESHPRWSPDGTTIVFGRQGSSQDQIYKMNANGALFSDGALYRIVHHSGRNPDWSPDGTKIAIGQLFEEPDCSRDYEIVTVNPDGSSGLFGTPLTSNGGGTFCTGPGDVDPDWSSDGTSLAFISDRDGNDEIYRMNANGSGQINLTNNPGSDCCPAWNGSSGPPPPPPTPDDLAHIVFRSSRVGGERIWVMNQTRSFVANLSGTNAPEHAVELSPNGTKILFTSAVNGPSQAWTMDTNGANRVQATSGSEFATKAWAGNTRIVGSRFVSNAKKIDVFAVDSSGTNLVNLTNLKNDQLAEDGSPSGRVLYRDAGNIWAINSDGTNKQQLTTAGQDSAARYSPNATKIAFTSGRDGNSNVYVMNADGTGQTRLTDNPAGEGGESLGWSPDGSKILYLREGDIYIMNADGTSQVNLSQTVVIEESPMWSPQGTKILFMRPVNGISQIFVMKADGTSQIQVSDGNHFDLPSLWLP